MNPIRICFVTREYAHERMGRTGGIGVFVKQFVRELRNSDFEIHVFSFGTKAARFDDDGIQVVRIRDLGAFNEALKSPFRTYKIRGYITLKIILEYLNRFYISLVLSNFVRKRKIDIVEFHDYGGDAPYFRGKPEIVIRCHGSAWTLHKFMGYPRRITDDIFERKIFRRFAGNVIAVSGYSAETTREAFDLQKMPKVIYNGLKIRSGSMPTRNSYLDAPTRKFSLYYFGSVRERKGIDIACRAFNQLVKRFPGASFHVMGNNNNRYWDTNAVKVLTPEALGRTTYYGPVPNDEIEGHLSRAHVVIFPSYGENFSIALLEVMALGKLVVTSRIPAFEEVIINRQNGFMAASETNYIEIISRIFEGQEDLETVSRQAFETVRDRFNAQQIMAENIRFYKSLLNRS